MAKEGGTTPSTGEKKSSVRKKVNEPYKKNTANL